MEIQKIIYLLNDLSNEQSKFTTKNKYNKDGSNKFETGTIKSSLCDYSDAYILVAGNITVNADNTCLTLKNFALSTCKTDINDVFIDEADHIYITMLMYNLIEYSDNYSDTGNLWQFKRDEVPENNYDLTTTKSRSFKYQAGLLEKKRILTVEIALLRM